MYVFKINQQSSFCFVRRYTAFCIWILSLRSGWLDVREWDGNGWVHRYSGICLDVTCCSSRVDEDGLRPPRKFDLECDHHRSVLSS